jgi:hypothetical protein
MRSGMNKKQGPQCFMSVPRFLSESIEGGYVEPLDSNPYSLVLRHRNMEAASIIMLSETTMLRKTKSKGETARIVSSVSDSCLGRAMLKEGIIDFYTLGEILFLAQQKYVARVQYI